MQDVSYAYANAYGYSNSYPRREVHSDTEASADSATAPHSAVKGYGATAFLSTALRAKLIFQKCRRANSRPEPVFR